MVRLFIVKIDKLPSDDKIFVPTVDKKDFRLPTIDFEDCKNFYLIQRVEAKFT